MNDPVKFMENLRELHSFGPEAGLLDKEQIDERTWLEKFHDWKAQLWRSLRDFFRYQFSSRARAHAARSARVELKRSSRIVSEAEFAQIPILNGRSWSRAGGRLYPPPTSPTRIILPCRSLSAGLYLLEATDGRFKAYTLLMVTEMALVTRTTSGNVIAYVVDRVTGQPIAGAKVDAGFGQKLIGTAHHRRERGPRSSRCRSTKSSPDNFWVVAGKGDEFAASTPGGWALTCRTSGKYAGYVFTERPVYRPTHTVHWKAILREHDGNSLTVPKPGTVHVIISDENDKAVFDRQMPLSATGDVTGDFELPKDAALGYYSLRVGDSPRYVVAAAFMWRTIASPSTACR